MGRGPAQQRVSHLLARRTLRKEEKDLKQTNTKRLLCLRWNRLSSGLKNLFTQSDFCIGWKFSRAFWTWYLIRKVTKILFGRLTNCYRAAMSELFTRENLLCRCESMNYSLKPLTLRHFIDELPSTISQSMNSLPKKTFQLKKIST